MQTFRYFCEQSMPPYIVKNAGAAGKGLFATRKISKGEVFLIGKAVPIPNKDWKLLSKTRLPSMYGFDWNGQHMVILGTEIPGWINAKELEIMKQTILKNGLHPFCFVNDNQKNANAKENAGSKYVMTMAALRDIQPGEEITKRYDAKGLVAVHQNKAITV